MNPVKKVKQIVRNYPYPVTTAVVTSTLAGIYIGRNLPVSAATKIAHVEDFLLWAQEQGQITVVMSTEQYQNFKHILNLEK